MMQLGKVRISKSCFIFVRQYLEFRFIWDILIRNDSTWWANNIFSTVQDYKIFWHHKNIRIHFPWNRSGAHRNSFLLCENGWNTQVVVYLTLQCIHGVIFVYCYIKRSKTCFDFACLYILMGNFIRSTQVKEIYVNKLGIV